jgi:hypothetical protein
LAENVDFPSLPADAGQPMGQAAESTGRTRPLSAIQWKEVVIPSIMATITIAGLASTVVMQKINNQMQVQLKHYEVTYLAKQNLYSDLMADLYRLTAAINTPRSPDIAPAVDKLETDTYAILPFLSVQGRKSLAGHMAEYQELCIKRREDPAHGQGSSGRSFLKKRDEIQELLIRELFESKTQAE